MPIARVQMPDGRIARIEVPEGTTPEQAVQIAQRVAPKPAGSSRKPAEKPTSFWQGVLSEGGKALSNLQSGMDALTGKNIVRSITGQPTPADIQRAQLRNQAERSPYKGSTAGNITGAVIGSLPAALVPGGPLVQGAAGGLILSDLDDPVAVVRDTAIGAVGGKVGEKVGRVIGSQVGKLANTSAGKAVRESVNKAVRAVTGEAAPDAASAASRGAPAAASPAAEAVSTQTVRRHQGTDYPVEVIQRGVRDAEGNVWAKVRGETGETGYVPDGELAEVSVGRTATPEVPTGLRPTVAPELAPLGRDAQARAARFEAVGIQNPTTGMVTRGPSEWTAERELAKLTGEGDALAAQILGVDADLASAGRGLVDNAGGNIGREATGLRVSDALSARDEALREQVSGLYRQVRDQRGDVSAGRLDRLREVLDSPDMMDNPVFDSMRDGVMRRLRRFGMAGDSGLLRNDAIATLNQAEELRKMIGQLGSSNDPATRMMRSRLIETLDDDVVDAVGDDAFRSARAAAKARFDEFRGTFPGKVAEEAIDPEKLGRRILSESTSLDDLRALRQSLTSGDGELREQGQKALQSLRGLAVSDIVLPGISPEGAVNGTAIYRAFAKNSDRLRVLLEPAEYKALRRYAIAARDATAQVPRSAVNNSNTASTLANLFARKMPEAERGALTRIFRHLSANLVGGPTANVGLIVGEDIARRRAADAAAAATRQQIAAASSPEQAVEAMAREEAEALAAAFRRVQEARGGRALALPAAGAAVAGADAAR